MFRRIRPARRWIRTTLRAGLITALLLLAGFAVLAAPEGDRDRVSAPNRLKAEPFPGIDAVDVARQILENRYQTELPEDRPVEPAEPPRAVVPDIVTKVILVLVAVLLGVVVFNLFYGAGRFPGSGDDDGAGPGEVDFDRLQVPDPDALAAAGRHAEAIHALLLRGLVLAGSRLDRTWPRSLTSREILGRAELPALAGEQLGQLVRRVEVHHFGGLPPVAADFQRCREIYGRLADELQGGHT